MQKQSVIILILCSLIIGYLVFDKVESGESYRLELQRERGNLENLRDSVESVIKRKDGELLKAMKESAEADMIAQESVKEAEKYRKKYESVKFHKTTSDNERDSLIRVVLSN